MSCRGASKNTTSKGSRPRDPCSFLLLGTRFAVCLSSSVLTSTLIMWLCSPSWSTVYSWHYRKTWTKQSKYTYYNCAGKFKYRGWSIIIRTVIFFKISTSLFCLKMSEFYLQIWYALGFGYRPLAQKIWWHYLKNCRFFYIV